MLPDNSICMGDTNKVCTCSDTSRHVYRCGKHGIGVYRCGKHVYRCGKLLSNRSMRVKFSVKLVLLCIILHKDVAALCCS